MNNLIFYVLLKMLFEIPGPNYFLEGFIKHMFMIEFKKRPTYQNLKSLLTKLEKSGKYDNLPYELDKSNSKRKMTELNPNVSFEDAPF